MSALKVLGAALGFAVLVVTGAQALSITNRDSSDYTVVIQQKGEDAEEVALPAGATIEDACEDGCTIGLADAAAQDATGADSFVVEAGLLKHAAE